MSGSIYSQILEATRDMRDAVHALEERDRTYGERMKRIETILAGNGSTGVCKRVEMHEVEIQELKQKAVARAARAGAIAGVLGFLGGTAGKILLTAVGVLH